MTVPTRVHGTGTLLVKGTEQSSVEYEITEFEVDQVLRTAGWIEASAGVLSYAHSATGAQLKLTDGQIVDVSIGCFIVNGSPSRAELIVHGGL